MNRGPDDWDEDMEFDPRDVLDEEDDEEYDLYDDEYDEDEEDEDDELHDWQWVGPSDEEAA